MFIYVQNDLAGIQNKKIQCTCSPWASCFPIGINMSAKYLWFSHIKLVYNLYNNLFLPLSSNLALNFTKKCLYAWSLQWIWIKILFKVTVVLCVKSLSLPLCLLLNPFAKLLPVTTMAYIAVIRVLNRSLAFIVCPSSSFVLLFRLPLSVAKCLLNKESAMILN